MKHTLMQYNRLSISGVVLISLLLVSGCNTSLPEETRDPLFTLMPASLTHAGFVNLLDYDEQLKKKFKIKNKDWFLK